LGIPPLYESKETMMAIVEPSSVNCVIYHADCTDGFGAAYSAWKHLGNRAEYHPCKHGTTPPDVKGKVVAILDFSYNNAITKQMIEDAESLIIIDHHKSAMVELHDISNTVFDMTKSGAILAWEFFHPGKESPKFIQYIQDRDLWKWELPYSKEFSAAFDMIPFEFEEFEKFEDDSVFDDAVKRGSYILAYSKTVVKKVCEKAVNRKFEGKSVMVVNASHWMSEIGARLSPDCEFAMIWYYDHEDKIVKVSLRAFHDYVDVSEISKRFGGGGHKKAAGFTLPGDFIVDELFDLEDDPELDASAEEIVLTEAPDDDLESIPVTEDIDDSEGSEF
jgi:oligoribonuclease NrnB/cAMP/cGMP phosphodiesterase (DHH superfamily)